MKDALQEALLYDFYGNLLKGRQREIYEASVMDDMSLTEISEEYGISRQAVSKMLSRCRKTLSGYEEELKLIKRFDEMKNHISEIRNIARDSGGEYSERIIEISDRILGDL